ncbi:MAG: alpha/beta hydrolase-fold protein [Bacteroidota bacterium]
MRFTNHPLRKKIFEITQIFTHSRDHLGFHKLRDFHSDHLDRQVKVNIYLPPDYFSDEEKRYRILLLNDGQDMQAIRLAETLARLYEEQRIEKVIVAAVHAGDRMHEFGTAGWPDYKNRGQKAAAYTNFILEELLPYLDKYYRCHPEEGGLAIAGFSLGGLSAMDIAWNHPKVFSTVGVFSGSFWWRSRDFIEEDPDADRIMHEIVAASSYNGPQRFWFQTGTEDEKEDRNNNGIIDAIDDTLDLIIELEQHGYEIGPDMKYLEIEGGRHHPDTWAKAMPDFLEFAFGR